MDNRFLVFRGPSRGQGIGATMLGLARALSLAAGTGRHVCVSWRAFELAFVPLLSGCPSKADYFSVGTSSTGLIDSSASFELWSFGDSTPMPVVAELLGSNRSVVLMSGDGGHTSTPHERPLHFPAQPRPELIRLLSVPPRRLVVHLRVGDPGEKHRGLFGHSPQASGLLVDSLPADAYVLTDSERVHEKLCKRFACPQWGVVPHSAERAMFSGERSGGSGGQQQLQRLQTWADWWTIKSASEHVLHTPSAFSQSALRFSSATACVLRDAASLRDCTAWSSQGQALQREEQLSVELRRHSLRM